MAKLKKSADAEGLPRMTITAVQKKRPDVIFEGEWTALLVRSAIANIRREYIRSRRTMRKTTSKGATTNG